MSRLVRYLKYGWTALCIATFLLFIAMWLGIYRGHEQYGRRVLWSTYRGLPRQANETGWEFRSKGSQLLLDIELPSPSRSVREMRVVDIYGFSWQGTWSDILITIPFWFLAALSAVFASIPWVHWSRRFSLRTLLVAMTLVAVVLALVVYPVLKK